MNEIFLFDTHAFIFWLNKENVSDEFIRFFDDQNELGNLLISSVSFWETAFLEKKGRIELDHVDTWHTDVIENSNIKLINPDASEMIESVYLPDYHKDPFDRLLIVQANRNYAKLVTKDQMITKYDVSTFWI